MKSFPLISIVATLLCLTLVTTSIAFTETKNNQYIGESQLGAHLNPQVFLPIASQKIANVKTKRIFSSHTKPNNIKMTLKRGIHLFLIWALELHTKSIMLIHRRQLSLNNWPFYFAITTTILALGTYLLTAYPEVILAMTPVMSYPEKNQPDTEFENDILSPMLKELKRNYEFYDRFYVAFNDGRIKKIHENRFLDDLSRGEHDIHQNFEQLKRNWVSKQRAERTVSESQLNLVTLGGTLIVHYKQIYLYTSRLLRNDDEYPASPELLRGSLDQRETFQNQFAEKIIQYMQTTGLSQEFKNKHNAELNLVFEWDEANFRNSSAIPLIPLGSNLIGKVRHKVNHHFDNRYTRNIDTALYWLERNFEKLIALFLFSKLLTEMTREYFSKINEVTWSILAGLGIGMICTFSYSNHSGLEKIKSLQITLSTFYYSILESIFLLFKTLLRKTYKTLYQTTRSSNQNIIVTLDSKEKSISPEERPTVQINQYKKNFYLSA